MWRFEGCQVLWALVALVAFLFLLFFVILAGFSFLVILAGFSFLLFVFLACFSFSLLSLLGQHLDQCKETTLRTIQSSCCFGGGFCRFFSCSSFSAWSWRWGFREVSRSARQVTDARRSGRKSVVISGTPPGILSTSWARLTLCEAFASCGNLWKRGDAQRTEQDGPLVGVYIPSLVGVMSDPWITICGPVRQPAADQRDCRPWPPLQGKAQWIKLIRCLSTMQEVHEVWRF